MGGDLHLAPHGYGCLFFFCSWQPGTPLHDPTCSWPGMSCSGQGHLIAPGESKTVEMDFTDALVEAGGTTGCCSRDGCCNLKGTATHSNPQHGEYAKLDLSFLCNFVPPYVCNVAQFDEEGNPIVVEENPIVVEENLIGE